MATDGRLELQFVNVDGTPIAAGVDLRLRHQELSEDKRVDDADGRRPLAITGLRREPRGLYQLEVRSESYWPVMRFVTVASSGPTRERITLPIRPAKARALFPAFDALDQRVQRVLERSLHVSGYEGVFGRALYDALADVPKAGLLNIARKSLATTFSGGVDLLADVHLLALRGDRCLVEVPAALQEEMSHTVNGEPVFRPVDGSLHDPPDGFLAAGSFKTHDAFGNLQLTLFRRDDHWRADVDIDDAAGLAHVFQVMRNHITGDPTHPYNIHQILIAHQHLDPGYRLIPA